MLIKDVPAKDYGQLFAGVAMFYKKQKRWVRIQSFAGNKVVIKFLDDRSETVVLFNDDNFSTEQPRVGMINIAKGVAFVSRIPKRVMKAGMDHSTMAVELPFKDRNCWIGSGIRDAVQMMDPSVVNMFLGIYPTFSEAVVTLLAKEAYAVAFDRQFCISHKGDVYFKGNNIPVGTIKNLNEKSTVDDIEWVEHLSPLRIIIGDNCAKTLQSFKQAPATRTARS